MKFSVEQTKRLIECYPYLKPRNVWTDEDIEGHDYSYLRGLNELPEGWHKLFLLYCKNLRPYLLNSNCLDKFRFSQLKEKYGTIRLYDFGCPQNAHYLSSLYEAYSAFVCYDCGKPSSWKTYGYITYVCNNCVKKFSGCTPIKRKRVMQLYQFTSGETRKVNYSYKHLHKEYIHVLNMSDEEFFNYIVEGVSCL